MFENLEKLTEFKYGENSHQRASIYKTENITDYDRLNGEELTFQNFLDMNVLINILSEFFDVNATVISKSALPVGVALGVSLKEAFTKAFDCNPVSTINSCIGFSKIVDVETAKQIHLTQFELVMAIGFDKEALEILQKDNNLKIIKINTPLEEVKTLLSEEIKITPFGILAQDSDKLDFNKDTFKIQTKKKPTKEQLEDAIFAYKVVKYAKSNACVITKDFKTLAIGQGQTGFADACECAVNYSCDSTKEAVMAVDVPIKTADGIHVAAQNRISLVIQAGGTVKDKEIIDVCDKYEMVMITTGISHFKS